MRQKQAAKFVILSLVVLLGIVFLPSLSKLLLSWHNALHDAFDLVVDLVEISAIAILIAGLLAPLEALGWWAGWYGDQIDTTIALGTLAESISPQTKATHYVILLDGIGQASFHYSPNEEDFLNQLVAVLPDNTQIIKGLMPYSVINRPLTQDRILSFFWRFAERFSLSKTHGLIGTLIGLTINIRNLLIVTVSADKLYGSVYNQGTAQVMYNSLIHHGYQPGSRVPITLIGVSGGGQIAMGALPYLQQALAAPIDVISLAGVISGSTNALKLEHLYHFVGDRDPVERLGPIMFPKRWKIFFLSYWNRAKRQGKISFTSLGPVSHCGAGGIFDPNQFLPDGRSYLQQTVDWVARVLQGEFPNAQAIAKGKLSNYERYQQAVFNQPSYYPLNQFVSPELYRPIAPWMGRLILPPKQQRQSGVFFEIHHAAPEHQHWVGQIVSLQWIDPPAAQVSVQAMKKDVHFSEEAEYSARQGKIHPDRLNHWRQVTPLESLAGARPRDDVIVLLHEPRVVNPSQSLLKRGMARPTLVITSEPVQITGRFYGLVKFLQPVHKGSDRFRVVHFNRVSRQFDGVEEVVRMFEAIANENGIFPSRNQDIEKSPLNSAGWYIYGAKDASDIFVVQAIAPRALLRLQPEQVIFGKKASLNYLKKQSWQVEGHKGKVASVLLCPKAVGEMGSDEDNHASSISQWKEGDRALLLHVYGGIGGNKKEPAAQSGIYFGHFAYGVARVVREPLADELCFDIEYHQVYCQNPDGIIAGTLSWSRYIGDRQYGWLGIRPVVDILIKFDALTQNYDVDGVKGSLLTSLIHQLEIMTARYRIGDGTGATYIGPANNCAQDSNQAMYAAIQAIKVAIELNPDFQTWHTHAPKQARRYQQLVKLGTSLRHELLPLGTARADWEHHTENLGSSLEDSPLKQLIMGLISWRTMLPRAASDAIAQIFLRQGASAWVLRIDQVGGCDPDIQPIAPITF